MAEYSDEIIGVESYGSDMQPELEIRFTRRQNGRTITVSGIVPMSDGTIYQRSADIEFR